MPVECVNCKFWELNIPATDSNPAQGLCHRFPPLWSGSAWVNPSCPEGDWCGEFSPKEAA